MPLRGNPDVRLRGEAARAPTETALRQAVPEEAKLRKTRGFHHTVEGLECKVEKGLAFRTKN